MQVLTITPPNTCGLVTLDSSITYVDTIGAEILTSDSATFAEYLTPDDAAAAAVAADPSYDVNQIYGPLDLEPVNVSNGNQSVYAGDSLTLNCEYSCGDCTVVYEWLNPGGLPIPGTTGSSLTLNNLTEKLDGTYTCNVATRNSRGQTGYSNNRFKVIVYPAITPGASELA